MICERCYQPLTEGDHGVYLCPLEPRRFAPALWKDSIEGGIEIAHGLCNADGTPRRYDSRSEIKLECQKRNLIPWGDVYEESRTKDARVHDDWLRSGEAQKARRGRVEARQEKYLKRDQDAARMR